MKKSLPKQRAKRPKAKLCDIFLCEDRVTILSLSPGHSTAGAPERQSSVIGAVLPCATQQQARQLVRWANLTYAQKVEALYAFVCNYPTIPMWEDRAAAILNLLGESPDPEN